MLVAIAMLAATLLSTLHSSGAHAQNAPATASAADAETGCQPAHRLAARRIAESVGVPIELVRCAGRLAVLRLVVPEGGPLDVELREPAEGSFRQIGDVGLSPIVEVSDYQDLPQAQRDAFDRLASELSHAPANMEALLSAQLPSLPPAIHATRDWPAFGLLGLLVLLLAGGARKQGTRREASIGWGLLALGLGLRLALGIWGPLHVNGQGPLWVSGALEPWRLSLYGPGYAEIFGWSEHFARPDHAIWVTNALLSALWAPLTWCLARRLGLPVAVGAAAGLVLAIDPVGVRIGATESYLVPLGLMLLVAALAANHGATKASRRQFGAASWAWLAAGLLVAQIVRTHPVGWLPCTLLPLFAWAPRASRRQRIVWLSLSAAVICGCALLLSGESIQTGLTEARRHGSSLSLAPLWSARRGVVMILGLAFVSVWQGRAARAIAIALMAAGADLLTRHVYGQSALWTASFDQLYLPMIVLGVAAAWPRPRSTPWRHVALLALPLAFALVAWMSVGEALTRRTTEQREYDFVAAQFHEAPAACWVAWVPSAGLRVVTLPTYDVPVDASGMRSHALEVRSEGDLAALALRTDCLLYVHSSLCQSAEGSTICRRVERSVRLEPLESGRFPAQPSYEDLPYDAPQVEVTVFRVRPSVR